MKKLLRVVAVLPLLITMPHSWAAADESAECEDQAGQILARLQKEVVGTLDNEQRTAANQIVLDVCQVREQQVEVQVEQAVQQARDEEQARANSWLTESADKPGNKRLKRKGH